MIINQFLNNFFNNITGSHVLHPKPQTLNPEPAHQMCALRPSAFRTRRPDASKPPAAEACAERFRTVQRSGKCLGHSPASPPRPPLPPFAPVPGVTLPVALRLRTARRIASAARRAGQAAGGVRGGGEAPGRAHGQGVQPREAAGGGWRPRRRLPHAGGPLLLRPGAPHRLRAARLTGHTRTRLGCAHESSRPPACQPARPLSCQPARPRRRHCAQQP